VELTSEQLALREAVRDLLRRHRSADCDQAATWRLLCGIGVAGLAVPERFGGSGASPVETSIVAEELGRVLAPSPLLGSAVLATQAILASGDLPACERLLPAMVAGTAIGALAWTGHGGGWDPGTVAYHAVERAKPDGEACGGWTLTGAAHYVLEGDHASVLIAAAATPGGGVGLFEIDPDQPGVDRQQSPSMDQTRRLGVVRLAAAANQ